MTNKNNSNKNNNWKRIAAGALSMALVAGALPANVGGFLTGGKAIVANAGFDDGGNTNTNGITYLAWDDDNKELVEANCDNYTEVTDQTVFENGTYVVKSEVTISDRIFVYGNVNLILCDGATLTASNGINVSGQNTLNIFGQANGTGTLIASTAFDGSAGIGSDRQQNCGTVTINGGTVKATGRSYGAGIGGGHYGSGGTVTVNGGTVEAKGEYASAGIGGGESGAGGTVTGNGGTVNAS
jgi:hypothetical protein